MYILHDIIHDNIWYKHIQYPFIATRFSGRLKRLCFFLEWFVIPKCYYYFFIITILYILLIYIYIYIYREIFFDLGKRENELLGQFLNLFYGLACRRVWFACKYTMRKCKQKKNK